MLSNSLGRTILLVGKWVGGYLSLVLPFCLAVLLGTILVTLSPLVQMSIEDWLRLGLFMLVALLYLAIFFSLGILVSSICHRSSTSLVICLFTWALLVFMIPNLGNILGRQFVKLPSVQQLEVSRNQIWIKQVFEMLNGLKIEKDSDEAQRNKGFQDLLSTINSENDKLISDYRGRFNNLVTATKNITRISPTASFTFLSTDLAGTGLLEERSLKQAVVQYKDLIWDKPVDSDGNISGDFPAFSYRRSSVSQVMSEGGLGNLAILLLFNILFFTVAYVSFLRYDVR